MLFWLVETENQLTKFFNRGYKEVFIEIIPYNHFQHPKENKVSVIYVKPLNYKKGYVFPLHHHEAVNLNIDQIKSVLTSFDKIYVRDKKEFLHYFPIKNTYDITLDKPYISSPTLTQQHFYNRFPHKKDINTIVPITKHYEFCQSLYNNIKPQIDDTINNYFNTKASVVFNTIERNGIRINQEKFEKHFHPTEGKYVYTQYNFKTLTKRPANKFNHVNYAALDNKTGCRESIIPRNDLLVELDITAYHPTMLSKWIGYAFKSADIHGEFAEMYDVDYNESKKITFRQLYGGIYNQYKDLPFFQKAQNYIDVLWNDYNTNGYVEDSISKYRFEKDKLEDMNPQKLLNYCLQHRETVNNIEMLWEILPLLSKTKTKVILTTYDSFLLDFDKSEKHIIPKIKQIIEKYGFNTKITVGRNYGEMSKVSL